MIFKLHFKFYLKRIMEIFRFYIQNDFFYHELTIIWQIFKQIFLMFFIRY